MVNVRGTLYENDSVKSDALERAVARFFEDRGFITDYPRELLEDNDTRLRRGSSHCDITISYKDEEGVSRRFILEVKSSACTLNVEGEAFLTGARRVLYVPIIPDEAIIFQNARRVEIDLSTLEGFYFDNKSVFLNDIIEADLVREGKKTSAQYRGEGGSAVRGVKTFYNNSTKKLVSKKRYLNLLDLMYENSTSTLEDFIEALEAEDYSILK